MSDTTPVKFKTQADGSVSWGHEGPRPPISIVILTLNEDINIRECLASCAWSDDVHVLDSGSTDNTEAYTKECGGGWHVNPFESFGAQRNWAIDNIPLRHEWVFHLDADERFTPECVDELAKLIAKAPDEAGFYAPSKLMLMGKWLKRAGDYPVYQMRLFHKDRMRFQDHGHGQRELTDGTLGTLSAPSLHYNFSKGLDDWVEKHNRYSRAEALQLLADGHMSMGEAIKTLFTGKGTMKRRALKAIAYRLPARPIIYWLYIVLLKRGLFDGKAGLRYATMRAAYESMIDVKVAEELAGRKP